MIDRQINVAGCNGTARWTMVRKDVDHERRDTADLDDASAQVSRSPLFAGSACEIGLGRRA
jgi:hypothetical protein